MRSGPKFVNPVMDGNYPDPGVVYDPQTKLWYVSTTQVSYEHHNRFQIFSSPDLVKWEPAGWIFPNTTNDPVWTNNALLWAPEIHFVKGRYVALFVADNEEGKACIGVATSSSPSGPFKDSGQPLIYDPTVGVIDPTLFRNPHDRQYYVYWKKNYNAEDLPHSSIWAQKLAPSLTTLAPGSKAKFMIENTFHWEGPLVEAPWVVARGKYFYLFYSANIFSHDYAVGVARSKSPLGPWHKSRKSILHSSRTWSSPGHCSVVSWPRSKRTYMVYHAWRAGEEGGDYGRLLMADEVFWSEDHWPYLLHNVSSSGPRAVPSP